MEAKYTVKKSAWAAISAWQVLLFWLIVPLIIMIVKIVAAKSETIEFYENRVVMKSGVLSKKEKQVALSTVLSVSIEQTLWGRIWRYGDVKVNVLGPWDIDTTGVANPKGLKQYLQELIDMRGVGQYITE